MVHQQVRRRTWDQGCTFGHWRDELFGGYPSFHRLKTARLLQQLPAATILATKEVIQKN
jgi:hypothetical protein